MLVLAFGKNKVKGFFKIEFSFCTQSKMQRVIQCNANVTEGSGGPWVRMGHALGPSCADEGSWVLWDNNGQQL